VLDATWVNGKREGTGVLYTSDNEKWIGNYKEDRRNGLGNKWFENGTEYEGIWDTGLITGNGVYTFTDGYVLKQNRDYYPIVLMNFGELHCLLVFKYHKPDLANKLFTLNLRGYQLATLSNEDITNLASVVEETELLKKLIETVKMEIIQEEYLVKRLLFKDKLLEDLRRFVLSQKSEESVKGMQRVNVTIRTTEFYLPCDILYTRSNYLLKTA